jgi:hypothetical protein
MIQASKEQAKTDAREVPPWYGSPEMLHKGEGSEWNGDQ